jgi:hypothetical protein
MALAMAEEMRAEFHHLGSRKCNLENLEEIRRYVPLGDGMHFVLIDEVDSASKAAQLALLSKLDSTDAPKGTVFVFTCNSTDGLEPRFLSRCLPIDFSSYGMAAELAEHYKMADSPLSQWNESSTINTVWRCFLRSKPFQFSKRPASSQLFPHPDRVFGDHNCLL